MDHGAQDAQADGAEEAGRQPLGDRHGGETAYARPGTDGEGRAGKATTYASADAELYQEYGRGGRRTRPVTPLALTVTD